MAVLPHQMPTLLSPSSPPCPRLCSSPGCQAWGRWNIGVVASSPSVVRSRGRSGVSFALAAAVTITASRVSDKADTVRVMGPGSDALPAIGRLLALDEFFLAPTNGGLPVADSGFLLESLVYYLEGEGDADDEPSQGEATLQPRHGVQLHYVSSMTLGKGSAPPPLEDVSRGQAAVPFVFHVRGPGSVRQVLTEQGDEGGAVVKVVAGEFAGLQAAAPLHDFQLLDVSMRPSSAAQFSVKLNTGVLVYVLEGVGLFSLSTSACAGSVNYQNEGHGLWFAPSDLASPRVVHVRTHSWSHLRFLLVQAEC